jgi:hypothetical protein
MSEQDTTEKEKEKEKDVFDNSTLSNALTSIFTQSNIIFLLWFLAIYFVLYFVLVLFFKSLPINNSQVTTRDRSPYKISLRVRFGVPVN